MENVKYKVVLGTGRVKNISVFELSFKHVENGSEYSRFIGHSYYDQIATVDEFAPIEEYFAVDHDHIEDDEQRFKTLYFASMYHLTNWIMNDIDLVGYRALAVKLGRIEEVDCVLP